jgi:biopolymer transport protein ExbB
VNKLLAQPASIDHAQLQDGEEAAAPAADAAAPAADAAAPAADAAAPAADAAAAAPAPDGVVGNLQATMGKFAPHLDKIHWPEK